MDTDKANEKGDKAKSADSGCAPTGHGMFEMMKKCCAGEEAFADCAAMMKSKMAVMTGIPCCGPDTEKTGPDRRKK